MKTIKIISALCAAAATFGWSACMDTDAQYTVVDTPAPTFTGIICNESDTIFTSGNTLNTGMQLYPGAHTVAVMFDENIGFATSTRDQITLNGSAVTSAAVIGASNLLTIDFTSPAVSELVLTIPAGLVYGPSRKTNEQEIVISWTSINVAPATALVNASATSEAKALYQTLLANYGQKILSGTMANVNWNNENAEQVYQWTGKYPAINCYDFIHLPYDGSWINYSDMTPVTDWHNGGGIVNAMWHWNVPTVEPEDEPEPQPGGGDGEVITLSTEEKVMPSDWSGWVKVEASNFSNAKAGDVVTAHTKDVNTGAQGSFKDGSSWSGLVDGSGTSYEYFDISGDFSMTLDATTLAAVQANGLIISGHDYTLTSVSLASSAASAPKRAKKATIQYTVRPDETTFKPSNCLIEGTWENEIWTADLAKVTGYLKTMQELGIPVLWRPFHEAKGNYGVYEAGTGAWFWWGAEGPDVFKKLWYAMFYYMQEQGVNNLIWVWTDIPTAIDTNWYPGDDFVDIVGVDIYSQTDATAVSAIMKQLQYTYPNKMVTLSECGNVAEIKDQFEAGATWSWFMPWYEGDGTNYAPQEWWQNAMNCEYVITRDMLK